MDDDYDARVAEADALRDLKRPAVALEVLGPAIAAMPNRPEGLVLAALCHLDLGSRREATALARRAVAAAPADPDTHRVLAYALMASPWIGTRRRAVASARASVALAPEWPLAWIAVTLAAHSYGNKKAARAAADRLIEIAPNLPDAHQVAGFIAEQQLRHADAEARYRTVLRDRPDDAEALRGLGVALNNQGRPREAVHLLANAARMDPTRADTPRQAVDAARKYTGAGLGIVVAWLLLNVGIRMPGLVKPILLAAIPIAALWYSASQRRRLRELPSGVQAAVAGESIRGQLRRPSTAGEIAIAALTLLFTVPTTIVAVAGVVLDGEAMFLPFVAIGGVPTYLLLRLIRRTWLQRRRR